MGPDQEIRPKVGQYVKKTKLYEGSYSARKISESLIFIFLLPCHTASFGPPVVSIEIENNSAIITMKGPTRYQPNHEKPEVHMATLYPQMMYNLSIHNTRRSKMVSTNVAS